ncbi:MAG TPA: flagellar biosynthetic protein FliO, partial [Phycisphaerae bacterium]|nr:flagellar biosynthetic protein FliO [Phycisphaerae bacterium]
ALRVVGRVPVGAKQSAALLQVGRRVVLVGIGPDGLRTLTEITDAQEVALLLGKSSSAAPAENFDHLLAEELEAYDATEEDAETPQEAARESLQATRGQLESLRSRIRALQSA